MSVLLQSLTPVYLLKPKTDFSVLLRLMHTSINTDIWLCLSVGLRLQHVYYDLSSYYLKCCDTGFYLKTWKISASALKLQQSTKQKSRSSTNSSRLVLEINSKGHPLQPLWINTDTLTFIINYWYLFFSSVSSCLLPATSEREREREKERTPAGLFTPFSLPM